jgi:phosphohistidine phosphatase
MKKKHKILYIVRHAKSSWDYDNIADIDRPLKVKGIKTAYEIARNIKLKNDLPELVISSPANRALHTAVILARIFDTPADRIRIDKSFYESTFNGCLDRITGMDDTVNTLMVIGHNPDFTDLANQFLNEPLSDLPTAGAVKLEFACESWKEIDKTKLVRHSFIFPVKENGEQ